jgi:L-rhamnose isomerase
LDGEQILVSDEYALAKARYAEWNVNTDDAIAKLCKIPISIHCWQADDVRGFEAPSDGVRGGGILATGNYPGRARTVVEAREDYDKVFSLVPGAHRLNLHASYGEFHKPVDRNAISIEHFENWVDWARDRGIALDFNSTCFTHPKADGGWTLCSSDRSIRDFWIEHVKRCREIAASMGHQQRDVCIHNLWIPDGAKDITVDRAGYRARLIQSLDACFAQTYNERDMRDAVESKLFGIGCEWFTAGSHELYLGYALTRGKIFCMDMGHYHPTESVADKVSAVLQYTDDLMVHVSRPVRWDSDHVVVLDDALCELAQEIVRNAENKHIRIALDFFDASINRIGAYVIGIRATLQALLLALLEPRKRLLEAECSGDQFTKLAIIESAKSMPFGVVWDRLCEENQVPPGDKWISSVKTYETKVLSKRS